MTAAIAVVGIAHGAAPAGASWLDQSSATHTLASDALAAPTAPSATHGPCNAVTGPTIRLSWTTTSSTWADGYEVGQSLVAGGPYTTTYTVAGQGTTTVTTPSLAFATTYYFVVKSTKQQWRSAPTAEVSFTTRALLCL